MQGGHLQRTISAPPLASVQLGRPMRDCLFEFTSIFDGDAFADSPPPAHKRPGGGGGMCNIHASSASDVRASSAPTTSLAVRVECVLHTLGGGGMCNAHASSASDVRA